MILPILAYGHPTLKKVAKDIEKDYPGIKNLIDNLFETLYAANGLGLAAPQVGFSIRVFIIDATPYAIDHIETTNFKKIFINAHIIEENGDEWLQHEGCLSVPEVREEVSRKQTIRIQYYDEQFNFHDEEYSGVLARIIQHEYDHLDGKLFVDRLSSLRKMLLKRKLHEISKGNVSVSYRMEFPSLKK